jgi:hypothetical protein
MASVFFFPTTMPALQTSRPSVEPLILTGIIFRIHVTFKIFPFSLTRFWVFCNKYSFHNGSIYTRIQSDNRKRIGDDEKYVLYLWRTLVIREWRNTSSSTWYIR